MIDQAPKLSQLLLPKKPAHRSCGGPAKTNQKTPSVRHGLESQLQTELDETWVVYRRVDRAEAEAVDVVEGHAELRMVEKVEEFRPEIQTHIFPRQLELFDHGEIGIHEI